jgi:hypothetical protein
LACSGSGRAGLPKELGRLRIPKMIASFPIISSPRLSRRALETIEAGEPVASNSWCIARTFSHA